MNTETVQEWLTKQPFEPFEVRMSNGVTYQVRHPEFAFVMKSNLVIGDPESERVSVCALLHIASIETLQQTA